MKEIELLKTIFKDSPDILKPLNEVDEEIERLNNDIKILLKENGNKEKVILKYDNIIKEAIEYIESYIPNYDFDKTNLIKLLEILRGEE